MSNQLCILSLVGCLSVASLAQSAGEPNAVPSENTKIVRVLDRTIYLKDIDPSSEQIKEYQKDPTSEQLNQWLKQYRKSALSPYIWRLFEEYAQQQGIEVTDSDIEQFNLTMRQDSSRQAEETRRKLADLQKELQADNLDAQKRSELQSRLDLYARFASTMREPEDMFKGRNAVAGKMVLIWKIYNRLYDQYGGRVIFQQAGPEPLDAMRRFFEEEQKKGRLVFYDKELEDDFWEYYRNDKMHTFYKDEDEAKSLMNKPWWVGEPKESWSSEDTDFWGDPVDGLCMKIRMQKQAFYPDQPVAVIVNLLNIGTSQFNCAPLEQFFEIEVDGQWYKWSGPTAADISTAPFEPKKVRYDFMQLRLTEQWLNKQSGEPLKVAEGVHTLRFRYKPLDATIENGQLKHLPENFEVTSNEVKFEVLPPRPPAKNRR